ncbi:kinase-like domain-containing protein [Mucidula mucida]|nr:kinase-like domain-containing protein [Mucidula mucida]
MAINAETTPPIAPLRTADVWSLGVVLINMFAPWTNIEYVPQSLAQEVMNRLQSNLDLIPSGDSEGRPRFIKCLRSLSTLYDILPAQLYLPASDIGERDKDMLVGGAFSDICRARYLGESVCLKVLRIHSQGKLRMERVMKAFCQEALIGRQVSHRNILPFYGVSTEVYPGRLCFISPWMEHGNINNFLESHPHHDRWQCLWDIAGGMKYLHGLNPCVIHKDIRGANVLVGKDFPAGTSTRNQGNIRWLPPALINESEFDPTLLKKVDIYSFGCTIIEIYTGEPPYSDLRTEGAVAKRIALKELPPQPPFFHLLCGMRLWPLAYRHHQKLNHRRVQF